MFRFRTCPLRRSRELLNDVANVVGLLARSSAWRFVRGGYPCSKNNCSREKETQAIPVFEKWPINFAVKYRIVWSDAPMDVTPTTD